MTGAAPMAPRRGRASALGAIALFGLGAALGACSPDPVLSAAFHLDRPTHLTFACYGDFAIDGQMIRTAQPIAACQKTSGSAPPPEGAPHFVGFVLQPVKGAVAAMQYPATAEGLASVQLLDGDALTPGLNSIPIGTLPVGLVTSSDGCYVISANAGTADLSVLDVGSALDPGAVARVSRLRVTTPAGTPVVARPSAVIASPAAVAPVGRTCPEKPQGTFYLAYPDCHLVAEIEAQSGTIQRVVQFQPDHSAVPGDGVTLPIDCSGGPGVRPSVLAMSGDGKVLYIGAANSPRLTLFDLAAANGTPLPQVTLEGDVGMTAAAASGPVLMGGAGGVEGTVPMEFVYAVASDGTVRVVEVRDRVECDTQVDPRDIYGMITDLKLLSCMPAGDPRVPPRRAAARSPGIHLPEGAFPLDVAILKITPPTSVEMPAPRAMAGHFAFVTSSAGRVYVVNIDDDWFADVPTDPAHVPLAVAHQLRDVVQGRVRPAGEDRCLAAEPAPDRGMPRLVQSSRQVAAEVMSADSAHLAPDLRRVTCEDNNRTVAVVELDARGPGSAQVFPDLIAVKNEQWKITWEGPVSLDPSGESVDGPPVRYGLVEVAPQFVLREKSAPFCRMGARPFDIAVLLGCDPSLGSADCGLGEECFIHSDTPPVIRRGLCLPSAAIDALAGHCKEILTTRRRFSIRETYADRLVLGERRRLLHATPIDGCTSDLECREYADRARALALPGHPIAKTLEPAVYSWACAPDPSRAPGPNRCQMTCARRQDCEPGWTCSGGFCVEATAPPRECVDRRQRFEVRVGDAYAVVGQSTPSLAGKATGFLHNRIAAPTTGECTEASSPHRLLVGRIPLTAPSCEGPAPPNPCSKVIDHIDLLKPPYVFDAAQSRCLVEKDAQGRDLSEKLRPRQAPAIFFQNPAFSLYLVDPVTRGDRWCEGDRQGDALPFATVHDGASLDFLLAGGFLPAHHDNLHLDKVSLRYPVRILLGPEGGLWILDQADSYTGAGTPRYGRIVSYDPRPSGDSSEVDPSPFVVRPN